MVQDACHRGVGARLLTRRAHVRQNVLSRCAASWFAAGRDLAWKRRVCRVQGPWGQGSPTRANCAGLDEFPRQADASDGRQGRENEEADQFQDYTAAARIEQVEVSRAGRSYVGAERRVHDKGVSTAPNMTTLSGDDHNLVLFATSQMCCNCCSRTWSYQNGVVSQAHVMAPQ